MLIDLLANNAWNYSNFNALDLREIRELGFKIKRKVLILVEGPTCSGKTTFILDVHNILKEKGITTRIIEEAATKIFKEEPLLLEKLVNFPLKSSRWKAAKLELQKKILFCQLKDLAEFAQDSNSQIALMDRGGASTAYHTLSYLREKEKKLVEEICREITKISKGIIVLSPLGFLKKSSLRYQNSLEDIKAEEKGIKYYLNKWKINYLELISIDRNVRIKSGVEYILKVISSSRKQHKGLKNFEVFSRYRRHDR